MMADQESEVRAMALFGRSMDYLRGIKNSVKAMGGMVCSDELSVDNQVDLIVNMLELETSTAEIIVAFELDTIVPNNVAICKRVFINTNKRIISHIEKLQEQGYRLSKVKKSLQLEVKTLERELSLMY